MNKETVLQILDELITFYVDSHNDKRHRIDGEYVNYHNSHVTN